MDQAGTFLLTATLNGIRSTLLLQDDLQLTNGQTRIIITCEGPNMVKKITFYDVTDAIQYRLEMTRLGYVTKMIHPEGKYEVIVAGEAPVEETYGERMLDSRPQIR